MTRRPIEAFEPSATARAADTLFSPLSSHPPTSLMIVEECETGDSDELLSLAAIQASAGQPAAALTSVEEYETGDGDELVVEAFPQQELPRTYLPDIIKSGG